MHGDALEEGAVVAGGFEACGFELVGDVFCGALVGFGAGVAAFHGVVGEGDGLGPPGGGGGVRLLWRLCGGEGQQELTSECGVETSGAWCERAWSLVVSGWMR